VSAALTREQFMTRGVALAGATATLAAFGPATMKAVAAGGNVDLEVTQFALLLERLEAEYYARALKEVPFQSSSARDMASTFADSETQHVDELEKLVRQLNGKAGRAPKFDFGPALSSEADFLRTAMKFEDTGVSAYNGTAVLIENDDIQATAGQIVQVEARHAARCRRQNGVRPAPLAFDRALTMDQAMKRVNPYIKQA
jgi:rubrerythrin